MLAHMMLANLAGQEMFCTEAEALRIATAWVGLRRHYGGFGIDPKHRAIFALVAAIGSVEVPKLRARLARQKAEREEADVQRAARDMAPGGTVVQLGPAQRGQPMQPGNGFPLHG